jgi:hypothetical protein
MYAKSSDNAEYWQSRCGSQRASTGVIGFFAQVCIFGAANA